MSPVSLAFFTIDHGTASTAVSLVAPLDGRFRLLAAGVAPRGTDLEALLEDLVLRTEAVEPGLLMAPGRLGGLGAAGVGDPPGASCAVPRRDRRVTARTWNVPLRAVAGRWQAASVAGSLDPLAAMDSDVSTRGCRPLALGSPDAEPDRALRARLGPLLAAVMGQRPDLPVLLCGSAADWTGLPIEMVVRLPAPNMSARPSTRRLRSALGGLDLPPATERWEAAVARIRGDRATCRMAPDPGRVGRDAGRPCSTGTSRRSISATAAVSGRWRIPSGVVGHLVSADAALVPPRRSTTPNRWKTSPAGAPSAPIRSRLPTGCGTSGCRPGGTSAGMARAPSRGAPAPPSASRPSVAGRGREACRPAADMLICAGGAFAAVPPPAAAMAVVDGMRRPGALTLFHDHARLLGPIGALPDDGRPSTAAGGPAR